MGQRDQLLDAIDSLYDAALGNVSWQEPLEHATAILKGQFCALEFIDKTNGTLRSIESGSSPEITQDYIAEYYEMNPRYGATMGVGEIIVDYHHMDEGDMNRHPFYAEFLESYGLRYAAGALLSDTDSEIVAFSVQRTRGQGHVQNGEIRHFNVLTPHLRRATLMSRRLEQARDEASDYAAGLDRLSDGIVFLDERGRVLHLNRSAADLLNNNDGLFVSGRTLHATVSEEHARLSCMIGVPAGAEPLAGDHPVEITITRPTGLPGYIVSAIPIQPHDARTAVLRGARTVLIIRDPMAVPPARHATLREAFGLTDAEASLALALAAGETPASYARLARVKISTIRTQVSALIQKMQVERQADVVRVVARMSALFRP